MPYTQQYHPVFVSLVEGEMEDTEKKDDESSGERSITGSDDSGGEHLPLSLLRAGTDASSLTLHRANPFGSGPRSVTVGVRATERLT